MKSLFIELQKIQQGNMDIKIKKGTKIRSNSKKIEITKRRGYNLLDLTQYNRTGVCYNCKS